MALVPFFHGYGLLLMLNSMISKGQLVILPHFDGHLFLSCIEKYKVSKVARPVEVERLVIVSFKVEWQDRLS